MGPLAWADYEFLALGLGVAFERYCCPGPADSAAAPRGANWDAEIAALQEIRRGRNDCG